MATEQPTAEEWKQIESRLRAFLIPVVLDCDGFQVRLCREPVGESRLEITVFVNGWFRGAWLIEREGHGTEEGRRFLQLRSRSLWSAKQKLAIRRIPKKHRGNMDPDAKSYHRAPFWKSTTSLRRHLVKHNDRIRWVE